MNWYVPRLWFGQFGDWHDFFPRYGRFGFYPSCAHCPYVAWWHRGMIREHWMAIGGGFFVRVK